MERLLTTLLSLTVLLAMTGLMMLVLVKLFLPELHALFGAL